MVVLNSGEVVVVEKAHHGIDVLNSSQLVVVVSQGDGELFPFPFPNPFPFPKAGSKSSFASPVANIP